MPTGAAEGETDDEVVAATANAAAQRSSAIRTYAPSRRLYRGIDDTRASRVI